jgi:hypothetical protein
MTLGSKYMVTKAEEAWNSIGDNPLVIISEIRRTVTEIKAWNEETSDFIQDASFDDVMNTAIRLISGDIPDSVKVGPIIVRLQAISLKFRIQYTAYMGWNKGTTDANMKKNLYRHTYEGIDRLVDALKYIGR